MRGVLTCGVTGMKAGFSHSPVCVIFGPKRETVEDCGGMGEQGLGKARWQGVGVTG